MAFHDPLVDLKLVHTDGENLVSALATTIVDASADACCVEEFSSLYSREFNRSLEGIGIIDATVIHINDHSLYYLTTRDLGIPGMAQREFRLKVLWKTDHDGNVIIDITNTTGCDKSHPVKPKTVAASAHTVWKFQALPPIENVSQTRVTFMSRADLKGTIPSQIINKMVPKFASIVPDLRKKFDRKREIDALNRSLIVKRLINAPIQRAAERTAFCGSFESKEINYGAFPLSSAWVKVTGRGEGHGKTIFKISTPIEDVAAYFWHFESRIQEEISGDIQRIVEERRGEWELIVKRIQMVEIKHGGRHDARKFRSILRLHKPSSSTIEITVDPVEENVGRTPRPSSLKLSRRLAGLPAARDSMRRSLRKSIAGGNIESNAVSGASAIGAKERLSFILTKISDSTKVEFTTSLSLGSHVS